MPRQSVRGLGTEGGASALPHPITSIYHRDFLYIRNGNGNGIRAYTGLITSPKGGSRGERDDATHTTVHPQPTQKRVWYTRCVPKTTKSVPKVIYMIELAIAIASHPVYMVASTIALLIVVGTLTSIVVIECKEHLRWY